MRYTILVPPPPHEFQPTLAEAKDHLWELVKIHHRKMKHEKNGNPIPEPPDSDEDKWVKPIP